MQRYTAVLADTVPPSSRPRPRGTRRAYAPRRPGKGGLWRVVHQHLETFLDEVRTRTDGVGLPAFVEREMREFLTCGSLARGFARVRCDACRAEHLVGFSCKARAVCPSCTGRRMAERTADLVDNVLADVPVRQWVLTLPFRLRYRLAFDHDLCRAVVGVYVRALLGFRCRRARKAGVPDAQGGAVTVIQRFGSALNLNVHFHTLVIDGVIDADEGSGQRLHPAPPPSDEDVSRLLSQIRGRVLRLLARRGISFDDELSDTLAEESTALAGLAAASVGGRVALGHRAGHRVARIGSDPDAVPDFSVGPRHAHLDGFDLHANLAVAAGDTTRLEHLCRYLLRPPVPEGRLELLSDGRVLLALGRTWSDGTTHLVFEPTELLERLAVLVPRPRINLILYHGVLAAHAARRAAAVGTPASRCDDKLSPDPADDSSPPKLDGSGRALGPPASAKPERGPPWPALRAEGAHERPRRHHHRWADLMRRTFEIDVLRCRRCGGRMRLIATIGAIMSPRRRNHASYRLSSRPPTLPLGLPFRLQLQSADGDCWESVFATAKKNDSITFKAKTN